MTTTTTTKPLPLPSTLEVMGRLGEWNTAVEDALKDDELRTEMIGVWMFLLGLKPVLSLAIAKITELDGHNI
jgi:hypothetical protein